MTVSLKKALRAYDQINKLPFRCVSGARRGSWTAVQAELQQYASGVAVAPGEDVQRRR